MKQTNLQLLDEAYNTGKGMDLRDRAVRLLQSVISSRKVLFVGYVCPYLGALQDCNALYAIPLEYDKQPLSLSGKTTLLETKKLPFPDEAFDVVISIHLLEFSRYSTEFLYEFARILDRQGSLINVSFNKCTPRMKCRSANSVIELIRKNHKFDIEKIIGLSSNLRVWPYEFRLNVSKYNAFLVNMLPFLSDMTLIRSEKVSLAPEMNFEPDYGIVNG